MTDRVTKSSTAPPAPDPGVVLMRGTILLLLTLVAFRQQLYEAVSSAVGFSDWSHVFALPVIVVLYFGCRKRQIIEELRGGTKWGLALIGMGLAIWYVTVVVNQFGYAKYLGLLCCMAGVIAVTAGGRVLRICLPLLLITGLCFAMSERTMERFSLNIQRQSLAVAVAPLRAISDYDFAVEGTRITYHQQGEQHIMGQAEQRFGMRLVPACFVVGLMTVFSRKRPGWQIVLLALASVPIVLLCNVLRIMSWTILAAYVGFSPASNVPRGASIVVALLAAYGLFALACQLLAMMGNSMDKLLWIEDNDASKNTEFPQSHVVEEDH